jgi:hypothetical protein
MKQWKLRLFTGGEDVNEIRPNYNVRNYHLFCAFLAMHSMLIFVAFMQRNVVSIIFLIILLLTVLQMGGLVSR